MAKLAFLLPLLLVAGFLFVKMRSGTYGLMVYAFGIGLAWKLYEVNLDHDFFPRRYFKYILILTCLAVAIRVLVYLLRMIAFPKRDWLLRQYREAYEAFLCPVYGYPIRRGPLKFMFWNRRSIKRLAVSPAEGADANQPYTCPCCSTRLYEPCPSCQAVRPSLLPSCEKCGATRPIGEE